jgi:hypothetical protein
MALALATPAAAFDLPYRIAVAPLGGSDFRTAFVPRAEETDYWCAAGAYVKERLGMSGQTRIYRLSPPPRKRGQGIDFTLDRARSAGKSGLSTFGGAQDGGVSASHAFQLCFDFEYDRRSPGFAP